MAHYTVKVEKFQLEVTDGVYNKQVVGLNNRCTIQSNGLHIHVSPPGFFKGGAKIGLELPPDSTATFFYNGKEVADIKALNAALGADRDAFRKAVKEGRANGDITIGVEMIQFGGENNIQQNTGGHGQQTQVGGRGSTQTIR